MFGKSSTQLLLQSPLPEDLLGIDSQTLIELLNKASKGRLSIEKSTEKVHQLKELSQNPFGIQVATDVFKIQIQSSLQQIILLEEQLDIVEDEMAELIDRQDHYLTLNKKSMLLLLTLVTLFFYKLLSYLSYYNIYFFYFNYINYDKVY